MANADTMQKLNQKLGAIVDSVVNDPDVDVWQFLAAAAVAQLAAVAGYLGVIAQVLVDDAAGDASDEEEKAG